MLGTETKLTSHLRELSHCTVSEQSDEALQQRVAESGFTGIERSSEEREPDQGVDIDDNHPHDANPHQRQT